MTLSLAFRQDWYCPNCGLQDTTTGRVYPNRMHTCPKLRMLTAPMVRAGTSAKVYLREREDYVGRERVQLDPERGRPVMSIVTERPDGTNDVIVMAPLAVADGR